MITYLETVEMKLKKLENLTEKKDMVIIVERSMLSNRIFAEVLHQRKCIDSMEYAIYQKFVEKFDSLLPSVDGVVYVKAPVDVAMKRIGLRKRRGENHVTFDFQYDLVVGHEKMFEKLNCPKLTLHNDEDSQAKVVAWKICKFVERLKCPLSKM